MKKIFKLSFVILIVLLISSCDLFGPKTDISQTPPKTYTVSFVNGGSVESPIEVEEGKTISKPSPKKSGYIFDGWFEDSELKTEYNFSTPITKDTVIYGKWTPNIKGVWFYGNNENEWVDFKENGELWYRLYHSGMKWYQNNVGSWSLGDTLYGRLDGSIGVNYNIISITDDSLVIQKCPNNNGQTIPTTYRRTNGDIYITEDNSKMLIIGDNKKVNYLTKNTFGNYVYNDSISSFSGNTFTINSIVHTLTEGVTITTTVDTFNYKERTTIPYYFEEDKVPSFTMNGQTFIVNH